MKKNYFAPNAHEVGIEIEAIMQVVSGEQGGAVVDPDKPADPDSPDLAGGSRGSWGSVW
ncbi:MAG: hypothetical protein J6Q98_03015 [Bacteroidaceae bacterium]|nr:hypothetical protein [Bacteroidaceae bacterium]